MIKRFVLCLMMGACIPHGGTAVQTSGASCIDCHASPADAAAIGHDTTVNNCQNCHQSTRDWLSDIRYQHSTTFSLSGKHDQQNCVACHTESFVGLATSTCATCHQQAADQAGLDHSSGAFAENCDQCHTEDAWKPANPTFHNPFFRLGFDHGSLTCSDCHETATFTEFTCISCHEHDKSRTDREHLGEENVYGYVYDSQACLDCHPDGRKEGD